MDSLSTITKLVTQNCYMASVDKKDAGSKMFTLYLGGELYEFTCLPNGLPCAPRIFTKILKPPLSTLHKRGHMLWHILMTFTYEG